MPSSAAGSTSLGCQVQPGIASVKAAACCPVPLAISRTRASAGSTSRSTARMAGALRAAAGEKRLKGVARRYGSGGGQSPQSPGQFSQCSE
jgi:hypothetical protein